MLLGGVVLFKCLPGATFCLNVCICVNSLLFKSQCYFLLTLNSRFTIFFLEPNITRSISFDFVFVIAMKIHEIFKMFSKRTFSC